MKFYISIISLLTISDFIKYLIHGTWPTFNTMALRAKNLGVDGVQVLILKGWKAEDIYDSSEICSFESSWEGKLGEMLFDKDSAKILDEIKTWRYRLGYPAIPMVDIRDDAGNWKKDSLIEIDGKKTKTHLMQDIEMHKPIVHRLVYDTHHAREVLGDATYDEWMLPIYQVVLGKEPKKSKLYRKNRVFRGSYNFYLGLQFATIASNIDLIQIQTRSKYEAESVMGRRKKKSIFKEQLLIIKINFDDRVIARGTIPIVIEIPPWWGWLDSSFKKRFIEAIKNSLM
jgi:hypothetical protein